SPEFMRDYESAMADQPVPVGADKVRPGTMTALALSYFASPQFCTLRPSTQRRYRNTIERLCGDRSLAHSIGSTSSTCTIRAPRPAAGKHSSVRQVLGEVVPAFERLRQQGKTRF